MAKAPSLFGSLFSKFAPSSPVAAPPAVRKPSGEAMSHLEAGKRFLAEGQLDDARKCLEAAIDADDTLVEAFTVLGQVFWRLGQNVEAAAMCSRTVDLEPNNPGAHYNLGSMFVAVGMLDNAVASFRKTIEINPSYALAYARICEIYQIRRDFVEAAAWARRALAVDPDQPQALMRLAYLNRSICDWSDFAGEQNRVLDAMRRNTAYNPGFITIMAASPAEQFINARNYIEKLGLPPPMAASAARRQPNRPIRLGYMSSDFREHAISYLTAELFELHDRSRFEVAGYALGVGDGSDIAARIEKGFDRFTRIGHATDLAFAQQIRGDGIDILVDLNGFTEGSSVRTLALRPAPIQVSYLGYPGTMGSDAFDYAIVDSTTVPVAEQKFFSEKLVHLPHCYQVNDRQRPIAARTPSRAEVGLPESGFVFCCFNNPRKITPDFFDIWCRLLKALPGSVLWLLGAVDAARDNLRREAEARGIDAARLIFAPKRRLADHLARHRCADLFLDTLPYNAHTTMSDALWAGLPAVTCAGTAFPGRVGASLLRAVGLPELVTTSLADYEALALAIASDPAKLTGLRDTLRDNLNRMPLFDTPQFVHDLEAAYIEMWKVFSAGRKPKRIFLGAGAPSVP